MNMYILIFVLIPFMTFANVKAKDGPNMGTCSYMGYNILKCIESECEMKIPITANMIKKMKVVGKNQSGLCVYEDYINVRVKDKAPFEVNTKCFLTENGRNEMAKEFLEYKEGNISIYTSSSDNPVIKKECKF